MEFNVTVATALRICDQCRLERRELIERSEEYRSSISKPKRHPALRKTNQGGSKRNPQKSEQIYFHG
jgi:hypothetical protein